MASLNQLFAIALGALLLIATAIWVATMQWPALQASDADGGRAQYAPSPQAQSAETVTLGYCPTMSNTAEAMTRSGNGSVALKKEPSAAAALNDLKHGVIDAALVGRPARNDELGPGFTEMRIEEGRTLVAREPGTIQYEAISGLTIHTYEETAAKLLPKGTNVVVHADLEQALLAGKDAVLIDWRDYDESMGLVTALNADGTKAKDFRAAVLYFREDQHKNALAAIGLTSSSRFPKRS